MYAIGGRIQPHAPARLLRLGHRGRRLRHHGGGRQRAHRVLVALPAYPRRVRLGAGRDGRRLLLRLSRLRGSEPLAGPADGSPRAAGRDGDGRGPDGGRPAAGPAGARAVASLCHPRRAGGRWKRRPGLYGSGALPPQLVRAPAGPGHERGLLRGGGRLHRPAALAPDAHRSFRLARRLLGDGHPRARPAGAAQPPVEAAARGARVAPRRRQLIAERPGQ